MLNIDHINLNTRVNLKIENILKKLELSYRISSNTRNEKYFWLDFEKPMKNAKDFKYSIAIIYDSDINNVTLVVPGIRKFKPNANLSKIYKKLNILNATTIFGSIYFMESEEKHLSITYSHSFIFSKNEEYLLENFTAIFDYLDFFILEAKNILSNSVLV